MIRYSDLDEFTYVTILLLVLIRINFWDDYEVTPKEVDTWYVNLLSLKSGIKIHQYTWQTSPPQMEKITVFGFYISLTMEIYNVFSY